MKLNASGNSGGHSVYFSLQKPCVSKTAGVRVKDTSISLCYPVTCGLPSCQAECQALGFLFQTLISSNRSSICHY